MGWDGMPWKETWEGFQWRPATWNVEDETVVELLPHAFCAEGNARGGFDADVPLKCFALGFHCGRVRGTVVLARTSLSAST